MSADMAASQCYGVLISLLLLQIQLIEAQDQELLTNKDNTFIIGFPAQVQLNPANMGVNRLYLTADENTEAFIQIPSIKENKIARLHPGGTMVVDLPGKVRMPSKTGLEVKRGIRIYANSSISVYGIDMMQESSDGFLALPLSFLLLGNEYMVMTYPPVMHSVVMVTAALSGTEVTFILKLSLAGSVTVNGMVYKSGDSFKISLNAMDSFQLMADSSAGSLTGTRLISNKVMSVYSGNDCANVPLNMSSCDHLVEQMPPISTWGKTFLVKSTAYRKVGDIFHILASQNQTTVRIELSSGPLVVKINAGEYYEFDSPPGSSHVITTSFPSLVVQYGKSHSVDKSKFAPFMSIVPATNQWSNDYTLVVPSALSRNFQCFANLVVSARETKNIETKSISPVHKLTWTSVPFTLYSTATVNLTSGQYRFYHKSPLKVFSVMFLCNADFEAFGFPAGLRLFRRSLSCTSRPMVPGDRRDNDCDDRADEELLNGIDDDGDGKIDEDLATPIPVIQAPASVNETECYIPSMRMASTPKHQAFGMCNVRGNLKIFYKDVSLPSNGCWKKTNRTWTLTDGCLNTITRNQIVYIYVQQSLVVFFPSSSEVPIDCDKLPAGQYDSGKPRVASKCAGKVSVSYKDDDWSKVRDCGYTNTVVVKRTWVVSTSCNKKTQIQYLRFKKQGWYPYVTVRPLSLASAAEKNVTLDCYAWGNPEPTVKWILPNGQYVDKSYSIQDIEVLDDLSQRTRVKTMQKDNSLLISETRTRDSGIYQCVATNAVGNDTGTVNLTIHDDLVDVDASVTLKDVVYSESLGNKQSEDFDSLAAIMKRELTEVFKNITGFQGINILGFRNGSVKVIFRVVIKKQNKDENPQVIVNKVGQHLAVSVKGGKLGDYEVVPTVELREKPPPPNKPQASEIKESTVHIEWDPPDLSIMFAISGYLLQYKQFGHVTWMTYDTVKGDNHRIDGLDAGTGYLIRTKSQNKYGHSKPSGILEITTLDKSLGGAEIALIIIIPIIVIITCVAVAWFFYKKRRKSSGSKRSNSDHPLLGNGVVRYSHPAEKIHIDENHKWKEISRDFMELGRILGEGEFGLVMEGKLTQEDGSVIRCAVKKLKRTATESDMKDLLNELDIMVQVGSHPNIVNLIGACAFGGPIMVVVEFAANGNLLLHLQKQSSRRYEDMAEYQIHIAPKQRLKIAGDVANGMAHLARRRCVHRDLAARNVLLDENWTAKVSDFGLSRDVYTDSVYEKTTGGKLPAKWMAIEALEAGLNTTQSDVWSFGVLLWEIETGGCIPYPAFSAMEMLAAVKQGYRLEKPTSCSTALYNNVMLKCWDVNPSARPSFDDLYLELLQIQDITPNSPSYYENINEDDVPREAYA